MREPTSKNAQFHKQTSDIHKMFFNVLKIVSLLYLLTVHGTELFRQYKQISGRRFSHVHGLISSFATNKLRCAVTCLHTANCDSFHYNNNTSSVSSNCELLMTSATDYDALTPAAGWSIYSSNPRLTSSGTGAYFFSVEISVMHKFTGCLQCDGSVFTATKLVAIISGNHCFLSPQNRAMT